MLLNHRYKFLYIHIAKTGGTSVRSVLNKLRWHDPMYYLMFPCHKLSNFSGHTTATKFPRHSGVIAAKEMLPDNFFNQLYKFGFVRNPWDLQVSSYHHIQREKPHQLKGIKNFSEFIGRYETLKDDFNTIGKQLGLKNNGLPHKRKATDRKKDYRSYYDDESIETVAKHYKKDIELLNYQFE